MTVDPESVGLVHHARAWPEKPALVIGDLSRPYGQLRQRVDQLARALRRAGVGEGGAVAAALHNGFEWFEILNAVGRIGARLVPVGYRLKGPEIAYMLRDSGAVVLITESSLVAEVDRALDAPEVCLGDDNCWVVGAPSPWRGRVYDDILGAEDADELHDACIGGGFNTLIYTSGTTGRPKGIERSADLTQGHATLLSVANFWGFTADDVHLICGPLYHTGPASYGQMHLLIGATVIVMPHYDAADCLRLIAAHRVTNTFMVPTHFARILQVDEEERRRHDLRSMRLVLHSAAPCPPHVKRGVLEVFPPEVITEFYAASETGVSKITAEEWLRKPGSVGRPWPGHEVRILGDEGGECAPGDVGLIYVKGPRMDFVYRGAEEKTRAAFRDGFFTAGDLGWLDEDGYLFIADRRTDLIITGGANVYPAEVEAVMMSHPKVADVAVVGIPDTDMGKSVLAVIELREGQRATGDELISFCRGELAHYKCPRRIEFVDHVPREPQGKVRKHELALRYATPTPG